jgi:hypothetical protein
MVKNKTSVRSHGSHNFIAVGLCLTCASAEVYSIKPLLKIIYAMYFPVSEYHFYYEKRKAFSRCQKRRSAEYTRTTFKLYLNAYTVEQNLVSCKRQELLTLRDYLGSPPVIDFCLSSSFLSNLDCPFGFVLPCMHLNIT